MTRELAAVTGPASCWEQAPGELAYYVLPDDGPGRQVAVLREMAGDTAGQTRAVVGKPELESRLLPAYLVSRVLD
jgi:hypothetical protein